MASLIEDMPALLSATTHAQPPVQAELNSAARAALNDLRSRLDESGGRVELGELPTVLADPTQMRQLLRRSPTSGSRLR